MSELARWLEWLEAIERDGMNLTPWEQDFIASIRAKFNRPNRFVVLTERQAEQLERIYAERTP